MRGHSVWKLPGLCLAIAATLTLAYGQKPLSPPADTSVDFNGKKIAVKYSAPSLRGRKGAGGLVPYGRVWRAGANEATALHTDADLDLGGLAVPKGDYTLYVLADENSWKLIVNKQTGQWGTEYNEGQDLGRVNMTLGKTPMTIETLKIELKKAGANKGSLDMSWENTAASVPFTVK